MTFARHVRIHIGAPQPRNERRQPGINGRTSFADSDDDLTVERFPAVLVWHELSDRGHLLPPSLRFPLEEIARLDFQSRRQGVQGAQ